MGEYDWVVGVSFSIASSVLSCLGLIFQKYAHNQNQALPDDKKYPVKLGIVCSPCWWASFIMMGLFPFPFDFFAYSFAAQSLVVPFAGLTLIMNQFFAPFILKEKVYRIDILASIVVFIGCTMTTVTGNHDSESYVLADLLAFLRSTSFVAGAVTLCLLIFLMMCSLTLTDPLKRQPGPAKDAAGPSGNAEPGDLEDGGSLATATSLEKTAKLADVNLNIEGATPGGERAQSSLSAVSGQSQSTIKRLGTQVAVTTEKADRWGSLVYANFALRPFYYGFISGAFGALQNIFFKAVGVLMKSSVFDDKEEGHSAWSTWYPYVFIIATVVLAVSQLSVLNKGMSRYDAILVFPLYNAMYIITSVTMGALFYGEFDDFTGPEVGLFVTGILITISGILLFVFKPRENNDESGAAARAEAATAASSEQSGGQEAPEVQSMASRDADGGDESELLSSGTIIVS